MAETEAREVSVLNFCENGYFEDKKNRESWIVIERQVKMMTTVL